MDMLTQQFFVGLFTGIVVAVTALKFLSPPHKINTEIELDKKKVVNSGNFLHSRDSAS